MTSPLMRQLSKSKIMAFRQCPKRLWLEIHRPDLREDSAATEAAFQVGYEVGDTARRIYDPLGQGTLIDINTEGFNAAFELTAELLAKSRSPIFEAAFRIHGALALADVLLPDWQDGKPAWRMVEVKSSTSVKNCHHDDIAVQSFIDRSSGARLTSVALAHIDSSWTYSGDGDYAGLLAENDFTEETEARAGEVGQWLAGAQEVASLTEEPEVAVGPQCSEPFECGFCNYCNRDKVWPEYPVTSLPRFSQKRKTACQELGIEDLRNVPDEMLGVLQQRVKSHTVSQTVFFDVEGTKAALAPHGFSAFFLDFETSTMPVPLWKGTRPYLSALGSAKFNKDGFWPCPHCGEEKKWEETGTNKCPACKKSVLIKCKCPKCRFTTEFKRWGTTNCDKCGFEFNSWLNTLVSKSR